jgi:hypothetical protein
MLESTQAAKHACFNFHALEEKPFSVHIFYQMSDSLQLVKYGNLTMILCYYEQNIVDNTIKNTARCIMYIPEMAIKYIEP